MNDILLGTVKRPRAAEPLYSSPQFFLSILTAEHTGSQSPLHIDSSQQNLAANRMSEKGLQHQSSTRTHNGREIAYAAEQSSSIISARGVATSNIAGRGYGRLGRGAERRRTWKQ